MSDTRNPPKYETPAEVVDGITRAIEYLESLCDLCEESETPAHRLTPQLDSLWEKLNSVATVINPQ